MTQTLLLVGDAQSEALALVFKTLDTLRSRYNVEYADVRGANGSKDFRESNAFDVIVEQRSELQPSTLPKSLRGRRVTFPTVRFDLLWPLLRPNGEPEFPWTDAFFESCRKQNIPRDAALELYQSGAWSPSWPNLDVAFKDETKKLLDADVSCDVKIGSYILKHFRRLRLFLAPNVPANALIGELAFRTLHACLGRDEVPERESIQRVLASAGASDLMSAAAVPIHPAVARHFSIEWYDPKNDPIDAAFPSYSRDLLDYVYARRKDRE